MNCAGQPYSEHFQTMAQVPPFGTHQWMHSIPSLMPWTLGQQPQNVVQFTGQPLESFQPSSTIASSLPDSFAGYVPQNDHIPLQSSTALPIPPSVPFLQPTELPTPRIPFSTTSSGIKRQSESDDDFISLQPTPKIHVTADKVTAKLSKLCIDKDSPVNSLPSSPEEEDEDYSVFEPCDVDEGYENSSRLVVSDELKSVLNGSSSDPLMGLGKQESDKICKAVVLWKPPKPLTVKVESITEVNDDDVFDETAPSQSTLPNIDYPDIEFEDCPDELETMTD